MTYVLPKRMWSALGWKDANRVLLCEAYMEVTSNAVKGTSQTDVGQPVGDGARGLG